MKFTHIFGSSFGQGFYKVIIYRSKINIKYLFGDVAEFEKELLNYSQE